MVDLDNSGLFERQANELYSPFRLRAASLYLADLTHSLAFIGSSKMEVSQGSRLGPLPFSPHTSSFISSHTPVIFTSLNSHYCLIYTTAPDSVHPISQ